MAEENELVLPSMFSEEEKIAEVENVTAAVADFKQGEQQQLSPFQASDALIGGRKQADRELLAGKPGDTSDAVVTSFQTGKGTELKETEKALEAKEEQLAFVETWLSTKGQSAEVADAMNFIATLGDAKLKGDGLFFKQDVDVSETNKRGVAKIGYDALKAIADGGLDPKSRTKQKIDASRVVLGEQLKTEYDKKENERMWNEAFAVLLATGHNPTEILQTAMAMEKDVAGIEGAYPELIAFDLLAGPAMGVSRALGERAVTQIVKSVGAGMFPETAIPLYVRGVRELGAKAIFEASAKGPVKTGAKATIKAGTEATLKAGVQGIRETVPFGLAFYLTEEQVSKHLGPVSSTLTSLVGVGGAYMLMSMTKQSMQAWLTSTATNNPKMYDRFKREINVHDDPFTAQVKAIMDDIEIDAKNKMTISGGTTGITGTRVTMNPMPPGRITAETAAATADDGALAAVEQTLVDGAMESKTAEVSKAALGIESGTEVFALFPDSAMGEEIPFSLGRDVQWSSETDFGLMHGELNNVASIQKAVGNDVFNSIMNAADLGTDYEGLWRVYPDFSVRTGQLADEAKTGFLKGELGKGGSKDRVWKLTKWGSHSRWLGDLRKAIVDIPTALSRQEANIARTLDEGFNKYVFTGLNKADKSELDNLFRVASDHEADWIPDPDNLGMYTLKSIAKAQPRAIPEHIYQKYANARLLLWEGFQQANKVELQRLRNLGYRQYGSMVVKDIHPKARVFNVGDADIAGTVWSSNMAADGWKAMHVYDVADPAMVKPKLLFVQPHEYAKVAGGLDDSLRVLEFTEGYFPIVYDSKATQFSVSRILKRTDKDGRVSYDVERTAAGRTLKKAQQASDIIKKRHWEKKTHGDGSVDELITVVAHRTNENLATDFYIGTEHSKMIGRMEEASKLRISEALSKVGWEADEIEKFLATTEMYGKRKPGMFKERSESGLKSAESIIETGKFRGSARAPLKPTVDSMRIYNGRLAKFIAKADWKENLKQWYVSRYGKYLDNGARSQWDDNIRKDFVTSVEGIEAEGVRRRLRVALDTLDPAMVAAQNVMHGHTEKIWAKGTRAHEALAQMLDDWVPFGVPHAFANVMKQTASTAYLGAYALSQMAVQSTVMLNAANLLPTNPLAVGKGINDFNRLIMEGVMMGVKDSEGAYLRELVKHSGVNAHLYTDTLFEGITQMTHKQYSSSVSQTLAGIKEAGLFSFKAGEKIGKTMVALINRRVLMEEIEAGLHKGMVVDSDLFLHRVGQMTDEMTGNFSKFNRQFYLTGQGKWTEALASSVLQFKSFPLFQNGFMFGGKMKPTQRAALWAAWVGMFGIEAAPMFWDYMHIAEETGLVGTGEKDTANYMKRFGISMMGDWAAQITNNKDSTPEQKRRWRLFVGKGALASMTDGHWDLAARASLAEQFGSYADGLTYQELGGPGFTVWYKLATQTGPATFDLLNSIIKDEQRTGKQNLRTAQQIFSPASGPSAMLRAFEPDTIVDRVGRPMLPDPTDEQRFQVAVGITPGNVVERQANKRLTYLSEKERVAEMKSDAFKVARLMIDNPATGEIFAREMSDKWGENNKLLTIKFRQMVVRESFRLGMDPDMQVLLDDLQQFERGNIPSTPYQLLGIGALDEGMQ